MKQQRQKINVQTLQNGRQNNNIQILLQFTLALYVY